MPLPSPRSSVHAAALGVQRQWTATGLAFPELLHTLSYTPTWLIAFLRMRAYARGDRARACVSAVEAMLCRASGCVAVDWPAGFGGRGSRDGRTPIERPVPRLPSLHPSHRLVLTARMATCSIPEAAALDVGLATAFGDLAPPRRLPEAARVRALSPLVPDEHRARWDAGLGLEPPALFRPPEQQAARRVVQTVTGGEQLDPKQFPELAWAEVVDLLATAAVVSVAACIGEVPPARAKDPSIAA